MRNTKETIKKATDLIGDKLTIGQTAILVNILYEIYQSGYLDGLDDMNDQLQQKIDNIKKYQLPDI